MTTNPFVDEIVLKLNFPIVYGTDGAQISDVSTKSS